MAFLVPCIELMHRTKFMPRNGTGTLVISPTRELAMQIYSVARDLLQKHSQTHGVPQFTCNACNLCILKRETAALPASDGPRL